MPLDDGVQALYLEAPLEAHYEGNDSEEKTRHARWEQRLWKPSVEGQANDEVVGGHHDQPPGMKRQRPPAHLKKTDAEKRWAVVAKQLSNNHAPLNKPFTKTFTGKSPTI